MAAQWRRFGKSEEIVRTFVVSERNVTLTLQEGFMDVYGLWFVFSSSTTVQLATSSEAIHGSFEDFSPWC